MMFKSSSLYSFNRGGLVSTSSILPGVCPLAKVSTGRVFDRMTVNGTVLIRAYETISYAV